MLTSFQLARQFGVTLVDGPVVNSFYAMKDGRIVVWATSVFELGRQLTAWAGR